MAGYSGCVHAWRRYGLSVIIAAALAAVGALGGSWGSVLGQTAGVPPSEEELAEQLSEQVSPPAALEYRPATPVSESRVLLNALEQATTGPIPPGLEDQLGVPGIESKVVSNAPEQATVTTGPISLGVAPESQVNSEREDSASAAQQGAPRTAPGAGETRPREALPLTWLTVSGFVALGLAAVWGVRRLGRQRQ